MFALKMVWRDLRGSWKRLLLLVLSISLGVAGYIGVKSFRRDVDASVGQQARTILSADVRVSGWNNFYEDNADYWSNLREQGVEIGYGARFLTNISATKNGRSALVDVRAVDGSYPMYGAVRVEPSTSWSEVQSRASIVANQDLFSRLDLEVGDELSFGSQQLTLSGLLLAEDSRPTSLLAIGPPVIVSLDTALASGLITPLSRIRYELFIKLPRGSDLAATVEDLETTFDGEDIRVTRYDEAQPRIRSFMAGLTRYLRVIGLGILCLGVLGVFGSIHAHTQQKRQSIAVMKCLGITGRKLALIYALQSTAIAIVGSLIGIAIGVMVHSVLAYVLRDFFVVSFNWRDNLMLIVEGLSLGILTTWATMAPFLVTIRQIKPLEAFRQIDVPTSSRKKSFALAVLFVAGSGALFFWELGAGNFFYYSWLGIIVAIGAFMLLGSLFIRLLQKLSSSQNFAIRHALVGLKSSNRHALVAIATLGIGVTFILATQATQSILLRQVSTQTEGPQPDAFFIDIQPQQSEKFKEIVTAHSAEEMLTQPIVRARMLRINNQPVSEIKLEDESNRRVLVREYAVSYRDSLMEGEEIVGGEFHFGIEGRGVSVADWITRNTDIKLGDVIEFDVQGVLLPVEVTSIRNVNWVLPQANFTFIFTPDLLDKAPQTFASAVRSRADEDREAMRNAIIQQMPNVTMIDVREVVSVIDQIVSRIGNAIRFMAFILIVVGVIILCASAVVSQYARQHETAIFRLLGATNSDIYKKIGTEYLVIGVIASSIAIVLAIIYSWILGEQIFQLPVQINFVELFLAMLIAIAGIIATGLLACRPVLTHKPIKSLTND